jgi:hypothetical protein
MQPMVPFGKQEVRMMPRRRWRAAATAVAARRAVVRPPPTKRDVLAAAARCERSGLQVVDGVRVIDWEWRASLG